jgi:AcrR family transcriptional regulator
MRREDREKLIIAEAVRYFADEGFGADTRALARRLHITQPALFKYFASKEALIERVFQHVYLSRWNPAWERLLTDRAVPLKQRLLAFYRDYAGAILHREWIRIFMFSGLRDAGINRRYLRLVRERIYLPLCAELRHHLNLPSVSEVPVSEIEVEVVRAINERIFYLGVRKWIYRLAVPGDIQSVVEAEVNAFFDGVPHVLRGLLQARGGARKKKKALDTAQRRD